MDHLKATDTLIVANWKAYFSPERALKWCAEFAAHYQPVDGVEVVVAVPFLCMREVAEKFSSLKGVSLAAQTVSMYPQGSYTGSTPVSWLEGTASYALVGHRERRHYFRETIQDVAKQVYELLTEGLIPIVCVDQENVTRQAAIFDTNELLKMRWAYTPQDADQLEKAHTDDSIESAVSRISQKVGQQPVLYGGGVNKKNARQIMELTGVQGVMLGRGCLDGIEFAQTVQSLR